MKYTSHILFCLFIAIIGFLPITTQAQEPAEVSVFMLETCAHCHDEIEFLEATYANNENVVLNYYNLKEGENQLIFSALTSKYGLMQATPVTLVRDTLIQGFANTDTTGKAIRYIIEYSDTKNITLEEAIKGAAKNITYAELGPLITAFDAQQEEQEVIEHKPFIITIPLTNKTVDVGSLSLVSLSLVLGLVDGFNPCAMWVLVMFLIILSQLGDKKKMIQYASIFLLAEGIMYFVILTAWYSVFDFISLNQIITPLIGLLAVGSGIFFLYRYKNFKPVCSVANEEQHQKIETKVQSLAKKPLTIGVFFGILGLAFSVNVFEFACSIGIPQAFTKILELNVLDLFTRLWYMFLYIIMYVFDDIIVLGLALYSFDKIANTAKYSKYSALIGGILMILIGIIMLINPGLLVF